MRMVEGVHDIYTSANGTAVVHVIGDVVEMEEPVHEIATNAKLAIGGIGVAP